MRVNQAESLGPSGANWKQRFSGVTQPLALQCDRCASSRLERMLEAPHLSLYKCEDCGWRFTRMAVMRKG
jgi:ribosomal protein L37AE/L43A